MKNRLKKITKKLIVLSESFILSSLGCFIVHASSGKSSIGTVLNVSICDVAPSVKREIEDIGYKFVDEFSFASGSNAHIFSIIGPNLQKYVLKVPKRPEFADEWVKDKIKTEDKLRTILEGYRGNVEISLCERIGDNYVIEKNGGESLLKNYDSLSDDEKGYILLHLAEFYRYLFGISDTLEIEEYESVNRKFSSYNVFDNLLKGTSFYDDFMKRDKKDEIKTWVLPDFHFGNFLYDKATKKISIIDCDGIGKGCIYKNFLSLAVCYDSQPGLRDFLVNLIEKINSDGEIIRLEKWEYLLKLEGSDEVICEVRYDNQYGDFGLE